MAFFPIKCAYCLQELSNKDVRFNLRTGIAGRAREIREDEFVHASHDNNVSGADGR